MGMSKKQLSGFTRASVIILVPVLLVCFFIAQDTAGRLVKEEDVLVRQQVADGIDNLANRYEHYVQSAMALSKDKMLTPGIMLQNGQTAMRGRDFLQSAKQMNGRCYDIALHYNNGKLYNSQGLSSDQVYFSKVLSCDESSTRRGLALLYSGSRGVCILETNGADDFFMLHVPVSPLHNSNGMSVSFIIPLKELPRTMSMGVLRNEMYLCFSLADGQETWFHGAAGEQLSPLEGRPGDGALRHFTTVGQHFAPCSLTIQAMYQKDEAYSAVFQVMVVHYLLIGSGVIMSLLLAWLFSRRRWRRIRQLGSDQPPKPFRWYEDDVGYMQAIIDRQAHKSTAQVQAQRNLVRSQAMTMLLHGLWHDRASLQECGVELNEEYYCVGGLMGLPKEQDGQALTAQAGMIPAGQGSINGQPAVYFVMELPNEDEAMLQRRDRAGKLQESLGDPQAGVSIVLSQVYQHLSIAGYAYTEVKSMLEGLQTQPRAEGVLCWEETVHSMEDAVRLDQDDTDAFVAALDERNQQNALQLLEKLLLFIAIKPRTEEKRLYLRYCLLQPLLWAVNRSEYEEDASLVERFARLDFNSGEEFATGVTQIVLAYCTNLPSQKRLDKALDYVKDNFARYDLSLEEVADFAGVSKSYMSRMFRQNTGTRYIDYLTRLRMEEARKLLLTTELSVAEIFERVGYIYKNSYSAKFKAFYGMNATEYRRMYRDSEASMEDKPL